MDPPLTLTTGARSLDVRPLNGFSYLDHLSHYRTLYYVTCDCDVRDFIGVSRVEGSEGSEGGLIYRGLKGCKLCLFLISYRFPS